MLDPATEARLQALEARLSALEARPQRSPPFSCPDLATVTAIFATKGGSTLDAQAFFDHYESNGWLIGRVPMRSLPHTISKWLRSPLRQHTPAPTSSSSSTQPQITIEPLSVWEAKQVIEILEGDMKRLKDRHTREDAFGHVWTDTVAYIEYQKLRAKRNKLRASLASTP